MLVLQILVPFECEIWYCDRYQDDSSICCFLKRPAISSNLYTRLARLTGIRPVRTLSCTTTCCEHDGIDF